MSIKIRKRNGRKEKFRKRKLISSLQKAGLETRMAKSALASINVEDGMSSAEIKHLVHQELEKIDRKVSARYWSTMGLKVRAEPLEVDGMAILSTETLNELGLHVGDQIDVFNGEKFEKVRTYPMEGYGVRPGNLLISHNDMSDIGVHPGSRIAARKHKGLT